LLRDVAVGEGWRVKDLASFAGRTCLPALFGAAVCVLASLVMPLVGISVFFESAVPDSARTLFAAAAASESVVAASVRTRFAFGLSTVALLLTTAGVALLAGVVLNAVLRDERRSFRRPVLVLTFTGALAILVWALYAQAGDVTPGMLGFFFARAGMALGRPITTLIATLHGLTSAVTLLLAISFSMLSAPALAGDRGLRDLANRLSLLKVLLFIASACLVTRVVQIYALYAWPASQLAPAAGADSVALSTSAAVGVVYSLFLASLYLPVAAVLTSRLRQAKLDEAQKTRPSPAAGEGPPLSVEQTLTLYGAPGGSVKDLGRVMALLSPVLVGLLQGPILAVVQKVASGGP
jgi:hypothetical protein